jgi:MYXO-CTERM domain-containing protein
MAPFLLTLASIVGGSVAEPGQWPSVVSLGACTGTMIHSNIVLFAAHCDDPTLLRTSRCERFPGGSIEAGDDFAFCVLAEPIDVPVALLIEADLDRGHPAVIAGFGLDGIKRWANTSIRCSTPRGQIIAGGDGADSCTGDSGGPLLIEHDGVWHLAGVLSAGARCGSGGYYSRIDRAVLWLEERTGIAFPIRSMEGDALDRSAPVIAGTIESEPGRFLVDTEDEGCGMARIRVSVDGRPRPPIPGEGRVEVRLPLSPGDHEITIEAEDRAGNVSEPFGARSTVAGGCTCAAPDRGAAWVALPAAIVVTLLHGRRRRPRPGDARSAARAQ